MNKIISILPFKEEFTQLGGAVAIGINEQLKHSNYKKICTYLEDMYQNL